MTSQLGNLIGLAASRVGQRASADRLGEIADPDGAFDPLPLFCTAWEDSGLDGSPLQLVAPTPADLPFVVWAGSSGWGLAQLQGSDGVWRGIRPDGTSLEAQTLDSAQCIALPRRSPGEATSQAPRAFRLVMDSLLSHRSIFIEALLATFLINLLTLGISLYSMQTFDRVIPNQGHQTLMVLTVGVLIAICLEFMLKQVRTHMVDRVCNAVDRDLSEWFFQRLMGIRMEARPASVGTLASQIKGFEMVRGVLASTSLFVLADVPFAIFFVLVIAMVGGWVAIVPLIALPIALTAGLVFQRAIQRHTRENLACANQKAGLLVEAVDGAESLKAISAEWRLQGRWNDLVEESAASDHQSRAYSAMSQNITVALQQASYVALIAVGAWLVTENMLTMGGLLACSIISNRAMAPIVQLPGVMVQWAHAKAAIEGLDKILALPNEAEQHDSALAPSQLDAALRMERIRFAYGQAKRSALEVERLEIKPGERVGLIGPIGSGKSTLLKLASGLYQPQEGKVLLSGMDTTMLLPTVVRETVGYFPQDSRLMSGTLRENLLLGLADPGDDVILDAARQTGLIELITGQPKGLSLEITEGGRGVSGGQKQLIALTRLLLAKPAVWVLDEPTGAMDADTERRIVSLLQETLGANSSAIIATHKTALIPLFTRLIVVKDGRIALDGPRDLVMAKMNGKA